MIYLVMTKKTLFAVTAVLAAALWGAAPSVCAAEASLPTEARADDGKGSRIKVALYIDFGCKGAGVIHLARLLKSSPEVECDIIDADDVQAGKLGGYDMLMMPGGKPFKTSVLSKQIGSSRLSFADGSYMEQFLDITPGSLSVLGLMNDRENHVNLLIDSDVLAGEYFGCHPCINTSSLRIRTADLMEKLIPAMGHAPTMVQL